MADIFKEILLNCRNFKCRNNNKGHCKSAEVILTPTGNLIDRVICIQAEDKEERNLNGAIQEIPSPTTPTDDRTG